MSETARSGAAAGLKSPLINDAGVLLDNLSLFHRIRRACAAQADIVTVPKEPEADVSFADCRACLAGPPPGQR